MTTRRAELSRTLNTLQSQHEELVSAHSSTAHASEIARLDTQKFRTAKAASDLEMEAGRLAQQRADLAARLEELEIQGVEGGDGSAASGDNHHPSSSSGGDIVDDEILLRLKVYRSLGIDLERDEGGDGSGADSSGAGEGGGSGEFTKAVVRNDRRGDVHVINLDKKFSRFFYANYFWQTL